MVSVIAEFIRIPIPSWLLITVIGLFALGLILLIVRVLRRKR